MHKFTRTHVYTAQTHIPMRNGVNAIPSWICCKIMRTWSINWKLNVLSLNGIILLLSIFSNWLQLHYDIAIWIHAAHSHCILNSAQWAHTRLISTVLKHVNQNANVYTRTHLTLPIVVVCVDLKHFQLEVNWITIFAFVPL